LEQEFGPGLLAGGLLARTVLGVIDEKWKDHLYDLDQLRAAIQYRAWGQKDPLIEYKQEAYDMFVGLMHDLYRTFAERWLKTHIELGPPPGGTATGPAGGRPGAGADSGPEGGLVKGPAPRRPRPMVASKPAADGLVSGAPAAAVAPGGAAVATTNPYAGVGRNDPCPCGSGKKFKKCHGAVV
jgi:preprotein translocase subunit SecA